MPIVSVVIPVYNGEKTIQAAIASVLTQTLTDLELLIINDGSQDQTLELIQQVQDDRLRVWSFPNSGPSASRNRGMELASSDYISFLDADDTWSADKLAAQLQALQANPRAGLAYSWTQFVNESGHPLHAGTRVKWAGNVYAHLLTHFFIESGSNALFRRSTLQATGGFDESLTAAEDWDLCLRIAAHYDFAVVPAVQIFYRQQANSLSTNVLRHETATLTVIQRAFEQAPAELQLLKKQSLANLYQYLMFKAIAGYPPRARALTAARFFWQAVTNDPTLLRRRSRLMAIMGLKILGAIALPPQQLQQFRQLFQAQRTT